MGSHRVAVALATLVAAAPAAAALPALPVTGDLVRSGFAFDAGARAGAPRISVATTDPDGSPATYAGVALAEIVREAGAPVGDAVRGAAARTYVVVSASDGYSALFSLAELRSAEPRCAPLVADLRNGVALPSGVGPLRVVAPCDLTHARSVRDVTALRLVVAPASPGA